MLGTKILEEKESPINGHLRVVKDLAWGVHIQAEGLTQSGGVVENIWKDTLKKVHRSKFIVRRCLILGLGGGSAAKIVRKLWPKAEITGVDIDPVMVEMGKKYLGLGLDKVQVQVQVQDAIEYCTRYARRNTRYDLVLVDLYKGYEYPEKFKSEKFLRLVLRLLSNDGVVVFNRLYYGEKRSEAMKFGKKLEKVFSKVEYFHPEANLMLLCYNI